MVKKIRTNISSNTRKMILPKIAISLDPKFKYYQNHEFHKLKQNLTKRRTFSIFHTNISSLNTNHENSEILLTNLDHKFDEIALSETWTSDSKQNSLESGTITGYQLYPGTTGRSMKSGCSFCQRGFKISKPSGLKS